MKIDIVWRYINIAIFSVVIVIYAVVIINKSANTWWIPWMWIFVSSFNIVISLKDIKKIKNRYR